MINKIYSLSVGLLFGLFITPVAYGAVNEKDIKNLDAWGQAAYWKTCKGFGVLDEQPCIGPSKNKCEGKSWVTPKYGDEYGLTLLVAVKTTDGGAYFCPTAIVGKNKNRGNAWTQYYIKEENCVWLCRPGRTGRNCAQTESNVSECDSAKLLQSDYDNVPKMDEKDYTNREDEIPNWGANNYQGCGVHKGQEHDLIMAVSNWLPSGHGAFVKPYIVRAERSGWEDMISWIDIYPAAATPHKDDDVHSMLGCKIGYKPNANGTDCVAIKPELCGESVTDSMGWCAGFSDTKYESNKDKYTLHTDGKKDGVACKWYSCKEANMAFADVGQIGGDCVECDANLQVGISSVDGVCYHCPDGKMFDDTATGSDRCTEATGISKDVLKYGKGKNSQTPLEQQCWSMDVLEDYKECVLSKEAGSLGGRTKKLIKAFRR